MNLSRPNNSFKNRNPYIPEHEKNPTKRLKHREYAITAKTESNSNKSSIWKAPNSNRTQSIPKYSSIENNIHVGNKGSIIMNNYPEVFRSSTHIKNSDEQEIIRNEEIILESEDQNIKTNTPIINTKNAPENTTKNPTELLVIPLKEIINRTKSREELKHLFISGKIYNREEKLKQIEDMKKDLILLNEKTINSLNKIENKKNEKNLITKSIKEIFESSSEKSCKEKIDNEEKIEINTPNYLVKHEESTTATKICCPSPFRSNVLLDNQALDSLTMEKNSLKVSVSNTFFSNSEELTVNTMNNNIQTAFDSMEQDDELVIESNDEFYLIPKNQEIQEELRKFCIGNQEKLKSISPKIFNNEELSFFPSNPKTFKNTIQENREMLHYSVDKRFIIDKENMEKNLLELNSTVQTLTNQVYSQHNKHTEEIYCMNLSIKALLAQLESAELHRRKLHTYIQELRGSIRVFCRVKPLSNELENDLSTCIKYPELNSKNENNILYTIELINTSNSGVNTNNYFHFDKVFCESSLQIEIFNEVKPFIQSALDGENICIFAYGPTGSGKTFTMQGPSYDNQSTINHLSGILPRSAEFIFDELTRLQKIGHNFKLFFAAMEVYNENIYDLLNAKDRTPLQTYTVKNNNIQVKNLLWNQIKDKDDINRYTKEASETRRSDSTKFNSQSSRSHAIFQIRIEATNRNNNEYHSLINIIDLAGSERNSIDSFDDKSKIQVENMKKIQQEANFINKSLTTLGRIINMLADKKSNKNSIPYRESKLTMILQVKKNINIEFSKTRIKNCYDCKYMFFTEKLKSHKRSIKFCQKRDDELLV